MTVCGWASLPISSASNDVSSAWVAKTLLRWRYLCHENTQTPPIRSSSHPSEPVITYLPAHRRFLFSKFHGSLLLHTRFKVSLNLVVDYWFVSKWSRIGNGSQVSLSGDWLDSRIPHSEGKSFLPNGCWLIPTSEGGLPARPSSCTCVHYWS